MNTNTEKNQRYIEMPNSHAFEKAVEVGNTPFKTYDEYIEHSKGALAKWFAANNIETNIAVDRIDDVLGPTHITFMFQCNAQEHKKLGQDMTTIFAQPKHNGI